MGGVAGFEPIKNSIVVARPYHYTRVPLPETEVADVGTQMQLHEVVLQELRSGINILQTQDDQIVQEANSIIKAH